MLDGAQSTGAARAWLVRSSAGCFAHELIVSVDRPQVYANPSTGGVRIATAGERIPLSHRAVEVLFGRRLASGEVIEVALGHTAERIQSEARDLLEPAIE